MAVLKVGDCFRYFQDIENIVKQYEQSVFVNYYISDSRSLSAAAKLAPKLAEKAKKELKFYFILYTCIHGGRKFRSKSTGARPRHSTFKQECPARIRFGLSDDAQYLTVKELNEDHNHVVSPSSFNHLPRQRKLDDDLRAEAALMLNLKTDKKVIQQHLQAKSGKVVLLRDVINIAAETRRGQVDNQLKAVVHLLQGTEGALIKVAVTEDSNLVGIFYQDARMQQTFAKFPELLIVDASHRLSNCSMPLHVLLIIDGNGETEIVGTFVAADETRGTVRQMVRLFKAHNPAHDKIQAIMTDKDIVERQVLQEELTQAQFLICPFHVLGAFRRDVTCQSMGIKPRQRDLCLDILQQIVYSTNVDDYNRKLLLLEETNIFTVIEYFRNSWEYIKDEFVECFTGTNHTLGNQTSNQLKLISEKIKGVCSKNGTLLTFYKDLLNMVQFLRVEHDDRALQVLRKRPVCRYPLDSSEAMFLSTLTPYAFSLLKTHLEAHRSVKIDRTLDEFACEITSSMGKMITSLDMCPCLFRMSTGLPCMHIMAVRRYRSVDIFDQLLIPNRWTRSYYFEHYRLLQSKIVFTDGDLDISEDTLAAFLDIKPMTAHQKFKEASVVTKELAALLTEAPDSHYDVRLQQMQQLREAWKAEKRTSVELIKAGPAKVMPNTSPDDVDEVDAPRYTTVVCDNSGSVNHVVSMPPSGTVQDASEVVWTGEAQTDDAVLVSIAENGGSFYLVEVEDGATIIDLDANDATGTYVYDLGMAEITDDAQRAVCEQDLQPDQPAICDVVDEVTDDCQVDACAVGIVGRKIVKHSKRLGRKRRMKEVDKTFVGPPKKRLFKIEPV